MKPIIRGESMQIKLKRAAFSVVSLSQPQQRIIRKQKKRCLMRFEHTHTDTQSVLHKSVYFTVRSS